MVWTGVRLKKALLAAFGIALLSLFVWSGITPGTGFEPLEALAMILFIGPWIGYRLLDDVLSTRQEGIGLLVLVAFWNALVVAYPGASLASLDARYYLALAAAIVLGLGMVYRGAPTDRPDGVD